MALRTWIDKLVSSYSLEVAGVCPTCDQQVTFVSTHSWLRDHFKCSNCGSIPRERALMHAIELYYPNFRELAIHESSPVPRGASLKLKRSCKNYVASQYDPSIAFGTTHSKLGHRSEDLEKLTFDDESFDLVVTQDVLEHVFDPESVFREIARTLRPGGAHIFTTPLVNGTKPTERCALLGTDGQIRHLKEPDYHGNPMDPKGSLVTMHWGFDIVDWIYRASRLVTTILRVDDLEKGIRAELIEVLISIKTSPVTDETSSG